MKKDIKLVLACAAVVVAVASDSWSQDEANGPPQSASPAITDAVKTLQQVCLPVLKGGDLKTNASAAGFRLKDGEWVLVIHGNRRIELAPPDAANPHLCSAAIYTRPVGQLALRQALNAWAGAQSPPLTPVNPGQGSLSAGWTTWSWQGQTPSGTLGVALGQEQPARGRPATVSESDLEVSLTPD